MLFLFNFMYKTKFFKKTFRYGANEENMAEFKTTESDNRQIDMVSIVQSLSVAFAIFGLSMIITRQINSMQHLSFTTRQIFGNNFVLMTLITTIAATLFPKFLGNIKGASELGTLLMLAWFTTIGATADINLIISSGLLILTAYIIAFITACTVIFSLGKVFNWRIENMMVAVDACIGGPPTVAALCATMKWNKLIAPGILVALYGVIIGNFVGIIVGNIWGALPFVG